MSKARVKANARATDQANMSPGNLATTSHTSTQNPPQSQDATQSGTGSRFCSWAEICLASGHLAPTPDDFNNWPTYAVAPILAVSDGLGRYDGECRICRKLERSGNHKGNLYENHYGNYPTHCPRWAEMNFDDRNDIAIAAQFCTRCMSPKYKSKGRSDLLRHSTYECYTIVSIFRIRGFSA